MKIRRLTADEDKVFAELSAWLKNRGFYLVIPLRGVPAFMRRS